MEEAHSSTDASDPFLSMPTLFPVILAWLDLEVGFGFLTVSESNQLGSCIKKLARAFP